MKINAEQLTSGENFTYKIKTYSQVRFTSPRHFHNEFEIAYMQEGIGKLFVGNSVHRFKKGDIFLFAPGLIHAFKNDVDKNHKQAKCKIIIFPEDFFSEKFLRRQESTSLAKLLKEADDGLLFTEVSKTTKNAILKLNNPCSLNCICDFLQLLDYLQKSERKRLSNRFLKKYYYAKEDKLADKLLNYIQDNYRSASFSEAARIMKMSSSSFARYFKLRTERTFTEYLNEVRVQIARHLLVNTKLAIKQICIECGYKNLSYFNRVFKKHVFINPANYRKEFKL